jgi:hypothetical protein
MQNLRLFLVLVPFIFLACTSSEKKDTNMQKGTFAYDLAFLKNYHKDLIVLGEGEAQLILVPAYQGRVMTSTAEGEAGLSYGWINHDLIASGKFTDHFSAFGGEDRLWLGPEGGQFSIYFKKGKEFTFDNWYVPKEIDTEPFDLVSSNSKQAIFEKKMQLENYSGSSFEVRINRKVKLLDKDSILQLLNSVKLDEKVKIVGFESENIITNTGKNRWGKSSGLLSLWVLSMLKAADGTTIFIPYQQGDSAILGKEVTADYFGIIPSERLNVDSGMIRFKADGNLRSKIGISPRRTIPWAASYDVKNDLLTIANFSFDPVQTDYVNSLWKIQEEPFAGDVVNAYNDGPVDGKQMGKFYELESSSPAAALEPGQQMTHVHRTIHIRGDKKSLDQITRSLFDIPLDKISLQ